MPTAITLAPSRIAVPIIAHVKVFFAVFICSSLPLALTNKNPDHKINIMAIGKPIANAIFAKEVMRALNEPAVNGLQIVFG